MKTISQNRAQLRADLLKFSFQVMDSIGISKTKQAAAMGAMLAKAFEIESKLDDEQVRQALVDGPGTALLKELNL